MSERASLRSALDGALSEVNARAAIPQRVVVVGGGVAGISTAYWLGRAGNAVTVLEAAAAPEVNAAPSVPGAAASFTGLLAPSSSLSPFFARPQFYRAQKVQWCPRTQYLHPNFRVGLFESGGIARAARVGILQHASRKEFLPSLARLYGLAMWNSELLGALQREWQSAASERQEGTLAVVFDDRTFADMLQDCTTNKRIVGQEATPITAANAAPSAVPAAAAKGQGVATPARIVPLDDRTMVARLPSLEPKKFAMAGVIHFQDEFAVDHLSFLARMRKEAADKYGVKFQYDTQVTALVTGAPSPDGSISSSTNRIVAAETNHGAVTGDAFVLCAGAHSKLLIHASHLPGVLRTIPTFTTKTHHVSFPNPDATAATADARIFPSASVLLPETHTQLTAFPREVRVSSGHDFNTQDEPSVPRASSAALAREEAALRARAVEPRLESTRLQQLLTDVSSVFPRVDKAMVAQSGAGQKQTMPGVSLRSWTFDGKPLLGRYAATVPNLYINGAHGHLAWTHALAAGQHVSNQISGLPTFIQPDAFTPQRFDCTK